MNTADTPPPTAAGFAWLIDDFVEQTPGVELAWVVSADGLLMAGSRGLAPDAGDALAATSSGLLGLGEAIAREAGRSGCRRILLQLDAGHLLFMRIGELAGLAVLTEAGANAPMVAHQAATLVARAGRALTPQVRRELLGHVHQGAS